MLRARLGLLAAGGLALSATSAVPHRAAYTQHAKTTLNQINPAYFHTTMQWNEKDRIIVVGDVHGCAVELEMLLEKLDFSLERHDKLIFAGDLVRKGPDSNRVVDIARECKALAVRGNHDEYAIVDEANKLGLSQENISFLQNLPLSITIPQLNVLVVHAGVVPNQPQVEQNEPMDLMTMRNVDKNNLPTKIKHGEGVVRWTERWTGPQHVVFGHDAATGLQQTKFATGLDTGCVYGRYLTALVLPEFKLVNVKSTHPDKFAKL